ncbi:MAG: hypothetical protein OXU96_11095 [Gammaproteobacteria bacterium]|nr:hypothetical protein [Gammaproteobacteria bacterium]
MREDFSAVDALLEKTMPTGVFGGKTKKTPTLSDSPAGSQVGFIYRNRLTHTAKLEYHLHKTNRQVPATVQLRLTLGHRMNLSFFEKSWPCRVCRPAKKRSAACAGCVRCWKPRDGTTLTR